MEMGVDGEHGKFRNSEKGIWWYGDTRKYFAEVACNRTLAVTVFQSSNLLPFPCHVMPLIPDSQPPFRQAPFPSFPVKT